MTPVQLVEGTRLARVKVACRLRAPSGGRFSISFEESGEVAVESCDV